ncbi:MAG: DUF4321 domain-containing protein [Acidobacteriota bacterium]
MARSRLQFWHLLVVVLLAAMLGTAIGDILALAFPEGAVGRFLSAGLRIGTGGPWDLDLRVIQITAGVSVRLTVLGAAGGGAALIVFFRRLS